MMLGREPAKDSSPNTTVALEAAATTAINRQTCLFMANSDRCRIKAGHSTSNFSRCVPPADRVSAKTKVLLQKLAGMRLL